MTVAIAASCTACGACLATCPPRALRPAPRRPTVVDSRCTDCWACIEVCPVDAITAIDASPPGDTTPAVDPIEASRSGDAGLASYPGAAVGTGPSGGALTAVDPWTGRAS